MADADAVIAAIFAAAREDECCGAAAEDLRQLYSEGGWEGPKIVEAIRTAGADEADQGEIAGFRGALPPLPIEPPHG